MQRGRRIYRTTTSHIGLPSLTVGGENYLTTRIFAFFLDFAKFLLPW
ncbi:hypothetical protein SAMN06309944_2340 [Micrococcales bacterium KH10]|nr:hypothetical protein SAMN06309944_2340 [Micrococcales bacterium KH10]